jgi:putative FmdB family regulatory protein
MPIYEYSCSACKNRFDELILDQKPKIIRCPECGAVEVNRLLSVFATSSPASSGVAEMGNSGGSGHTCGCGHCTCGAS